MMEIFDNKIVLVAFGIFLGWITKVPLLIKWYRELQETKDYKDMMLYKRCKPFLNKNEATTQP